MSAFTLRELRVNIALIRQHTAFQEYDLFNRDIKPSSGK